MVCQHHHICNDALLNLVLRLSKKCSRIENVAFQWLNTRIGAGQLQLLLKFLHSFESVDILYVSSVIRAKLMSICNVLLA